jgi:hypothetical protein
LSLTGALSGAGIAASQLPTHKKTPSQQVQSQTSTLSSHQSTTASHRVLFAVQGSRWSLDLEQIPVTSLLNDPAFFRELKTRYKKHRSLIRRLVSPFRFRYCRFVKVCSPFSSSNEANSTRQSSKSLTLSALSRKVMISLSTLGSRMIMNTHRDQAESQ